VFSPDASYGEVKARIVDASLRDDDTPPHCTLEVDTETPRRLLGVEAYWADAFHTPRYVELLRWSVLVVPWAVLEHFLRRFRRIRTEGAGLWPIVREGVILTIAIHLAPVFVLLLAMAWILTWVPLRATQSLARAVISTLSATIGDSYVLLGSPGRRAAILERTMRQLKWLREHAPDAKRIWIVAHSQGCAITHELVARLREEIGEEALVRDYGLVTFGSGLRKLTALRALGRFTNPVWLALIFVFTETFVVASGALLWLQSQQPLYLLSGSMGNLGVLVVLALFVLHDFEHVGEDERRAVARRLVGLVAVVVVVAVGLTITVGVWFRVDALTMSLAIVSATSAAAAGGGLTLSHLMLGWREDSTPDPIDAMADLTWHDFYASHDPVPNGPIDVDRLRPAWSVKSTDRRTSTMVVNRASLLADHTSYFANVEQVLLPLSDLLLDGTLVHDDEAPAVEDARRRRTRFVVDRQLTSWLAFAATGWLMLVQFDRVHGWAPVMPQLLDALVDPGVSAPLLRVLVLGGLPVAAVALVGIAWRFELTLRAIWVLRRYRMRWSRLTIYALAVWAGGVGLCLAMSPAAERLRPLAIERAAERVRAYVADSHPPPWRRTPPVR
jgi:hypothetical protein